MACDCLPSWAVRLAKYLAPECPASVAGFSADVRGVSRARAGRRSVEHPFSRGAPYGSAIDLAKFALRDRLEVPRGRCGPRRSARPRRFQLANGHSKIERTDGSCVVPALD